MQDMNLKKEKDIKTTLKNLVFYSLVIGISLIITYLFFLMAILDSFFFTGFMIYILSLSAFALSSRFFHSYTNFVFDSSGITYCPCMRPEKKKFHTWNDVAKKKIKPDGIFMRFKDGDSCNLFLINKEITKKIADTYSIYLEGKEENAVKHESKDNQVIGPIQNDFCTMIDTETVKGMMGGTGVLMLLLFLTGKTLLSVYLSECLVLIPIIYFLLTLRTPMRCISCSNSKITYHKYMRLKAIINHSWNEVIHSDINPYVIKFKFSNGDIFKTSGTKTDMGRRVAKAYESYLSSKNLKEGSA